MEAGDGERFVEERRVPQPAPHARRSASTSGGCRTSTSSDCRSVEDVYLFRGVARDNPSDERLFALAEVRDLTPVRDDEGDGRPPFRTSNAC